MKDLAFTGTQRGMTDAQWERFTDWVRALPRVAWFHHGDCVGADAEAHEVVRQNAARTLVQVHPCTISSKRAYKSGDIVSDPLPPLERNRVMVDVSEALVATPGEMVEELRSGTWATIRYARKQKKPVHIIWPDGSYTEPKA